MIALVISILLILSYSAPAESGSRGWGPALGYMLLAAVVIFVYWLLLLYRLASAQKLNAALWVFCSIISFPLSAAVVHFLMFFKVRMYLEGGGT
jgi:hypothetical protein